MEQLYDTIYPNIINNLVYGKNLWGKKIIKHAMKLLQNYSSSRGLDKMTDVTNT